MRKLITAAVVMFFCISATAQYWETGVFVGASNYQGDFDVDYLVPQEYNLAFGLMGRYRLNRHFSVRPAFFIGQISGSDRNSTDPNIRIRNLNFRSTILELSTTAELWIGGWDVRDGKMSAPYLFAGLGLFHFNPQADFRGRWYDLQPLGTEGQGTDFSDQRPYSRIQLNIPIGIGYQIALGQKSNIAMEFGFRKTFTDYLDDIGGAYPDIDQLMTHNPEAARLSFRTPEYNETTMPNPVGTLRGNPNDNDWYFFFGMTITTNLADKYTMEFDERYKAFGPVAE